MTTLYLLDIYTESKTGDQHSDVIFGLKFFLTSRSNPDWNPVSGVVSIPDLCILTLHMLLQTSMFSSILKITASNFQEMLLRDITLQRQH